MTNTEPTQLVLLEDDHGKATLTLNHPQRDGTTETTVVSGYLHSVERNIETSDNYDGTKDGVIDLTIRLLGLHRVEPGTPAEEPEPEVGPRTWNEGDRVRVQDERFTKYHGIPGTISRIVDTRNGDTLYNVEFDYTTEDTAKHVIFIGSELKGEGE